MTHGWTIERTKKLFRLANEAGKQGKSLTQAYRTMAEETGLSEGSVRNYYYSHLHTFAMLPEFSQTLGIRAGRRIREFETFPEGEAEQLVKTVLQEQAKGKSVRKIVHELSDGDAKVALRYQNKYRSIVCNQRARAERLMAEMDRDGAVYYNPYGKSASVSTTASSDLAARFRMLVELIGEDAVAKMLTGMTDLVCAAAQQEPSALTQLRAFVEEKDVRKAK